MDKEETQKDLTDIERLDELIKIMYADITSSNEKEKYKMTDLLRAMEFKRKLAPPDDGEVSFWDLINGLRNETLPNSSENQSTTQGGDAE